MRGKTDTQALLFSYIELEGRIPKSDPVRKVRQIIDSALREIEYEFDNMYAAQ